MNFQRLMLTLLLSVVIAATAVARADDSKSLHWHDDYAATMQRADQENKNVLIYFYAVEMTDSDKAFENKVLTDSLVRTTLSRYVLAKLPADVTIQSGGKPYRLLDHPVFANVGRTGVAIVNVMDKRPEHYKQVVATLALSTDRGNLRQRLAAAASQHMPVVSEPRGEITPELHWHTDYREAVADAVAKEQNLFVYFYHPAENRIRMNFENKTLANEAVRQRLAKMTLVKLPIDAQITSEGKRTDLIKHASFEYMYGRPGLAIIDLSHPQAKHYHHVVSAYPFSRRRQYDAKKTTIILDLPAGTLTQRTLVYAVKIHPDSPRSTQGRLSLMLALEAQKHSQHQARINYQGHHNWESRFHSISARLPSGVVPVEVCAESWPDEELVDAAIECVHSWRQSSGHWSAVRARHAFFGYDMKRGSNHIWYGTGIFGGQ